MTNPSIRHKRNSLSALRALASNTLAQHERDMQTWPAYRRLHLQLLSISRSSTNQSPIATR